MPSPTEIRSTIRFHDTLNPNIWDGREMRLDVRLRLLRVALAFYAFIEVGRLRIADIIVTGSNAAFNYTAGSDIDVHLVVDYADTVCPTLAENFFATKKNLWNLTHEVSIRGHEVEVYVEDQRSPAYSNGVYSILRGEWVNPPKPERPRFDDQAVLRRVDTLAGQIDDLIQSKAEPARMTEFLKRLRRMRQDGLARGGEFSTENLTYKALRGLGYVDRLFRAKVRGEDAGLSL